MRLSNRRKSIKGSVPFVSLALVAMIAAPAWAATLNTSGYVKNLYDYSRSPLTGEPFWLDLTRARLTLEAAQPMTKGADGPRAVAHVDYDHELRTGSYLDSLDYRLFGLREPSSYLDLDQTISTGNSYLYRHRLYRAWAAVETEEWTARFGRQRVAWGTGKIWNPTDVLNPFDPLTVERDERRGVDALYVRRGLGALGQGEAAWALGDSWPSSDLLGRLRGHAGSSDVSVMGGKLAGSTSSWMAGGDFAANLFDGNLHGEWSYTEAVTRTSFWRAVIGYEYTLSSSFPWRWLRDLWILGEYYHNGNGETDPGRYQPARLLTGREIALGQDYLGLSLSRELHPLLTAEVHQILNLHDDSHFLNALLSWNALKNLYLTAGIERFAGSHRSEFGRAPNLFYLQGQYFF